jgi:homoserine O-acetyltransferase
MTRTRIATGLCAAALFCGAATLNAYDGPVDKKVFTLATYTTVGGKTLKNVRVGYETYGKLNATGDNAIFVPHFFTGSSHAAGSTSRRMQPPGTGTRSSAPASRSIPTSISSSAPMRS